MRISDWSSDVCSSDLLLTMKQLRMPRPKIGIALGAGVARGWTHIGVLKALKRAGIEADIVAGTSIGALVGGCLVADRLEPLEDFARSLTRRRMLSTIGRAAGRGKGCHYA